MSLKIEEVWERLERLVDDAEVCGLRAFVYRGDLRALLDDRARLRRKLAERDLLKAENERLAEALRDARRALAFAAQHLPECNEPYERANAALLHPTAAQEGE